MPCWLQGWHSNEKRRRGCTYPEITLLKIFLQTVNYILCTYATSKNIADIKSVISSVIWPPNKASLQYFKKLVTKARH